MLRGPQVSFKYLILFTLIASITLNPVSSYAVNPQQNDENPEVSLVVQAPLNENQKVQITVTEKLESSPEDIQQILEQPELKNTNILLTTDQEKVIETVVKATSSTTDSRLLRIIPLGKLASAKQKIASGLNGYKEQASDFVNGYKERALHTLKTDRIGLTVVIVSAGIDSWIWFHSSSYTTQQQWSMFLMNVLMSATFGLDRDLWANMTAPLKNRLMKVFDRFIVNEKLAKANVLASQFLGGFIFGTGIQATRIGLLSLDHLYDAVSSGPFWLDATKIAGLATATSFTWTEMYAKIDLYKQPIAKIMMKRVGEIRSVIMASLASVSMVLQPEVFGSIPIIAFVTHGVIGFFVLKNHERVIEFLETNPTVYKIYQKVQTFESFINGLGFKRKTPTTIVRTCHSLFAN